MRGLRMVWAALTGYIVDVFLSSLIVGGGYALANIAAPGDINFTQPVHVLVGLVLPVLMTMVGGGVAGALAPLDPTPAGALVGGLGLITMAAEGSDMYKPHALVFIIAQCVAVFGAAAVATLVARRRRSPT